MTEKILATIICPECGIEWRDEAPGSVECPNSECRVSFEVDEFGEPIQYTVPITCDFCGETWHDDPSGPVECPNCKTSFEVDATGNAISKNTTKIICPECEGVINCTVPGFVKCSNCEYEFEVDEDGNQVFEEEFVERLDPSLSALEALRQKLLDLTVRNRLLNYKETSRSIRLINIAPDDVYRMLVNEGLSLELLPSKETDDENIIQLNLNPTIQVPANGHGSKLQTPFTAQPLERRCKKLLQESRTAIEETGSNMLFIALGFLEWYEDENSAEIYQSPLILIPVRIEKARINRRTNCYTYIIAYTGEDIETNLSLREKLVHNFNLILPELNEDVIPSQYFRKIKQVIRTKNSWVVNENMILGMSSFAKILMFKDLDNNRWPENSKLTDHKNVMQILVGKTSTEEDYAPLFGEEYSIDKDSRSHKTPLILDADSSQLSAIIDALWENKSIVVEGPPGTGKSQTISNLIAAALNERKTILFVAEKKAALDVVKTRLDKAGLGDFCLELHSHKTQKGQLHADIGRRVSQRYVDSDTIDEEIKDLAMELEKIRSYSNIVEKTVGPKNEKIHDIFWKVERLKSEVSLSEIDAYEIENALRMSHQQIDDRISKIEEVSRLHEELPDAAINAWFGYRPISILPGDEQNISHSISSLVSEIDQLRSQVNKDKINELENEFNLLFLRELNSSNTSILENKPADFDSAIGCKFLETENVQLLLELSNNINNFKELISESEVFAQNRNIFTEQQIKELFNDANIISKIGYGNKTLIEVQAISETLDKICSDIKELQKIAFLVQNCLASNFLKFNDFLHLNKICQLFIEAPKDIFIYAHPEHTLELANDIFKQAQNQCRELSAGYASLSELFETQLLPDNEEILSLARELKSHNNKFLAMFSGDYRRAKKCIKEFIIEEELLKKPDLAERLRALVHLRVMIKDVCCNEDNNKILGPVYKGIDTNWDRLESLLKWSQKFSETINSQTHAYSLISKINDIREILTNANKSSQEILSRIINSLNNVGISINMDNELKADYENLHYIKSVIDLHTKKLLNFETLNNMTVKFILSNSKAYLEAMELKVNIETNISYRDLLESNFIGIDTDHNKYREMTNWVIDLKIQSRMPSMIVEWLVSSDTNRKNKVLQEFLSANDKIIKCYDQLYQLLEKFGKWDTNDFCGGEKASIFYSRDKLESCINNIQYLLPWAEYCRSCEEAVALDLEIIVNLIAERKINKDSTTLYQFIVYNSMAKELIRQYPQLSSFTRANYENIIKRFTDIDKRLSKNWQKRIAYNTSQRRVARGVGSGYVSEYTELNLILKEIQKKKRHIPIRQLIKRAGSALQALKPCFMMSPMSVAQYLEPGEMEFDLVIMDEASQIRPADAIGAIARAKQFVVVGDSNQLPPTTFFERTGGEDYEEEETTAVVDMESILDICLANYQKRRLRWHYRSEHESLIAFSNNQFYDDDLIVFPAPHKDSNNNGIHYHFIENAKYQKGRNRIEADKITDAIIEHFTNRPNLSLGIATFNREQADLIQDSLEKRQKELSWLETKLRGREESPEPFFIKNLENVQGDERDVIFISTTYGPDAQTGIVYQRFGPLSADSGWRRLNVIVSRAKKRLEVFTSMKATDIKLLPTSSRGVRALKTYLEYAETGKLPTSSSISGREPESDFEIAVAKILINHGFKIEPQVGVAGFFIDIGVRHHEREDEFICGIECDGKSYHSAKSVRDRDRLRQEILERKGWIIHRIWSTDWFKNREKEIQRLLNRLEEIIKSEKRKTTVIHKQEKESVKSISKDKVDEYIGKKDLRELLIKYNEENILTRYPDNSQNILRKEMLDYFIMKKPLTRPEFLSFPKHLRENTDGQQTQFLEDIFEIIDDCISQ